MSKSFLTVLEAIDVLDDQEDTELVVLPPESKGDITKEENDDESLMETGVIEEVTGEVEVFHPSLKIDLQIENPTSAETQKRRKVEKFDKKKSKKLKKGLPEDILQPLKDAH